jgi:hypothetical protein
VRLSPKLWRDIASFNAFFVEGVDLIRDSQALKNVGSSDGKNVGHIFLVVFLSDTPCTHEILVYLRRERVKKRCTFATIVKEHVHDAQGGDETLAGNK